MSGVPRHAAHQALTRHLPVALRIRRQNKSSRDPTHSWQPTPHPAKNFFANLSIVPLVRMVIGPNNRSTTFRYSSESKKFPFGHQ